MCSDLSYRIDRYYRKIGLFDIDMNKDILICGVGGQGTVLASKLISEAFMKEGNKVHSAETIGMAQRGGSVTSHVRVGDVSSPLIRKGFCDMIISFEPSEAVRSLSYLKKNGVVIVNSEPVKPTTETLNDTGYDGVEMIEFLKDRCKTIIVSSKDVTDMFGSSKFFNIYMLGVAAGSGSLGIEKAVLLDVIRNRVPEKFVDVNIKAFEEGYKKAEGDKNEA